MHLTRAYLERQSLPLRPTSALQMGSHWTLRRGDTTTVRLLSRQQTSTTPLLMQDFYKLTLEALQEANNERLWFKTQLKLCGLWFRLEEFSRMQRILRELHRSDSVLSCGACRVLARVDAGSGRAVAVFAVLCVPGLATMCPTYAAHLQGGIESNCCSGCPVVVCRLCMLAGDHSVGV